MLAKDNVIYVEHSETHGEPHHRQQSNKEEFLPEIQLMTQLRPCALTVLCSWSYTRHVIITSYPHVYSSPKASCLSSFGLLRHRTRNQFGTCSVANQGNPSTLVILILSSIEELMINKHKLLRLVKSTKK